MWNFTRIVNRFPGIRAIADIQANPQESQRIPGRIPDNLPTRKVRKGDTGRDPEESRWLPRNPELPTAFHDDSGKRERKRKKERKRETERGGRMNLFARCSPDGGNPESSVPLVVIHVNKTGVNCE